MCILAGMIPGMIAKNKGRNFIAWWAYGTLLIIPALPHALLLKPDIEELNRQKARNGFKKCPFCAEWVPKNTGICTYCGKSLTSLTKAYDSGWNDPGSPDGRHKTDAHDPLHPAQKTEPF